MEMCYDGALVMPSSYAVMNEEEMTYVEGGYYIKGSTIRNGIIAFCIAYNSAPQLVAAGVTLVAKAIAKVWSCFMGWVGATFGGAVGKVVGNILGYYTGLTAGSKFALAAISGKGIEISWNGLTVK